MFPLIMPWTKTDYPPEMKYLPEKVRERAISIANSLVKETNMPERSVIHAAIAMARGTSTQKEHKDDKRLKKHSKSAGAICKELFVMPYLDGWAIRIERSVSVHEIFSTKALAVKQAKREAFLTGAAVTIFKRDGVVEKRIEYNHQTKSPESKVSKKKG